MESVANRIEHKGNDTNIIKMLITEDIEAIKLGLKKTDREVSMLEMVGKVFNEYKYNKKSESDHGIMHITLSGLFGGATSTGNTTT